MEANYKIITSHCGGTLYEVYNYKVLNEVHVVGWFSEKYLRQNNHSVGVWKPKAK